MLVQGFLESAGPKLKPCGEAHVALKMSPPYDRWKVGTGGLDTGGLQLIDILHFDAACFPGYHHQTTEAGANRLGTTRAADAKLLKTLVFARKSNGVSGFTA